MHEMGHQLGLEDSYAIDDRDSLMYGYLVDRRAPAARARARRTARRRQHRPRGVRDRADARLGTLPAGQTVTIQWQATIDPQTNQLIVNPSNQGTVSATNSRRLPGYQHQRLVTTLDSLTLGNLVFNDVNGNGMFESGSARPASTASR